MSLADKLKDFKPTQWKRRPEVLLCNQTVKPLHGVVPRIILGQEWWDKTRQAAYASTDFHCIACGVYKRDAEEKPFLEGHEMYETDYAAGRSVYVECVPLCHWCHAFIHDGRLKMLRDKGEITQTKYDQVLAHGKRILKLNGLKKVSIRFGPIAKWEDWRLVIDGIEYPPKYKNYDEWLKAFNPADE